MSKNNFYISYVQKDGAYIARNLYDCLTKKGYSVCMNVESQDFGNSWFSDIKTTIADCDCFIPIITDGYIVSEFTSRELEAALHTANNRAKDIFPIVLCSEMQLEHIDYDIRKNYFFRTSGDEGQISNIADRIDKLFSYKAASALLYEKLNAFSSINNDDKVAETVCLIFELIRNNYEELISTDSQRIALYKEIYRLYEILYHYHGGSYSKESGRVVRIIMPELNNIQNTLFGEIKENKQSIFLTDIYCISFSIRIYYLCKEIRNDCIDTWTTGDVVDHESIDTYIKLQEQYKNAYYSYHEKAIDYEHTGKYSDEDVQFIKDTPKYILSHQSDSICDNQSIKQKQQEMSDEDLTLSEDEQILISIANFTKEGNRLFNLLRKKGNAGDFLRCLLTSYERLKNYCEVIGAQQIVSECVEQIAEIKADISSTGLSQSNETVEKGIKSLLGITISGMGKYDVFISYKSQDEDLGKTIYDFFRKNMKEAFWSKVSLPELSESEYENAIYDALDKAKHFVVVLSDLSYLKDTWVEKEMKIFHREKTRTERKRIPTLSSLSQTTCTNKLLIQIKP